MASREKRADSDWKTQRPLARFSWAAVAQDATGFSRSAEGTHEWPQLLTHRSPLRWRRFANASLQGERRRMKVSAGRPDGKRSNQDSSANGTRAMAKKNPAPKKKPARKPAAKAVETPAVTLPDPSLVGRTYTPEQIKAVLDAHYRWLKGETGGVQANLTSANLTSANLTSANLTSANLTSANLTYADLTYANLRYANLTYANLTSANLTSANLTSANLTYANLRSAKNSELVIARTRILPDGDLIGWKKCRNGVIVKLRIPETAKRSHAFARKCRAEFVTVLEVIGAEFGTSIYDSGKTEYRVGETVKPDTWCEDFTQECAGGIHFYISRIEAENHE